MLRNLGLGMGVGSGGGGSGHLDFHGTDKVKKGLMMLFFRLVFPLPTWKFFCLRPWI